MLYFLYSSHFF